ncbi:hypothetical protein SUGI_0312830 [Cryptomeria japonica]|uniref:3-ketoacyl-CoA synthase 17 n=1 Tax=Cryptomeria japonica TaxID=3369 RepID=UPI002408C337|nr:3-ketoacyl-CoA synthase 17 [Cryptomeria japonica]GLJ17884.1 hypothetical protein SUGI_0312830 [Cryptomeria japonica]
MAMTLGSSLLEKIENLCANYSSTAVLLFWTAVCAILVYYVSRPPSIYLLGFSAFKPGDERKCSYELSEYFTLRTERFDSESVEFMLRIFLKSGIGDETYGPPFPFRDEEVESLEAALDEATEVMFGAVDAVFNETRLCGADIDIVISACGMLSTAPSLTSMLINRYNMKEDVKCVDLVGMGCSSGVMAVHSAADLLRVYMKPSYALVVMTENITLNTYYGNNKSMLVTNCIFREGCAAVILSSRSRDRTLAKMELLLSLRTHRGADDQSYEAAFQHEDEEGVVGISLKKDLIRVAGEGLRAHVSSLAPLVLPLSEQLKYLWSFLAVNVVKIESKLYVPDFSKAFEHVCLHTGGKAVLNEIARSLQLSEYAMEPARMALHRFGNTSSSSVFYELAYFEAKERIKKGDRVWMIAFGTGFKCCSIVWKALKDLEPSPTTNPWLDCIHRYPVKS